MQRNIHILTGEDIDDFTFCLLNFTQIRWCIIETFSGLPRKLSAIFGNREKFLKNVRQRFV